MTCPRHRLIAGWTEHGIMFCLRCFLEALETAEDDARDARIAAMWNKPMSVEELMRRLTGR
jgi:hypothetical protein